MLKIQIMDMLLPWLLKTGGKLLITVLIAVIGYKVIRAIRKGVGRSMGEGWSGGHTEEVSGRAFICRAHRAPGVHGGRGAGDQILLPGDHCRSRDPGHEPFPSEYHGKLCRRRSVLF